jgi:ribosome-binding protein aMBF1 (putative translation factor)
VQTIRSKRHRFLVKAVVEAREQVGMSQAELARRLKQYQSWAARLESGERRIDVVEFLLLAEIIGFNPIKMLKEIMRIEAEEITGPVPNSPPARRHKL